MYFVTNMNIFLFGIGIAVISGAFCYDVILDNRLNDWKPTNVSTITSSSKSYKACILVRWFFSNGGGGQRVLFIFIGYIYTSILFWVRNTLWKLISTFTTYWLSWQSGLRAHKLGSSQMKLNLELSSKFLQVLSVWGWSSSSLKYNSQNSWRGCWDLSAIFFTIQICSY